MSYVFLDLETSGLDPKKNFITEVGAIKTDDNGRIVGMFNTYIEAPEGEKLDDFIVNYTGITDGDLAAYGMPLNSVIGTLRNFIEGSTVVAQFAPFDLGFLEAIGVEVPVFYCTRTMSYEIDATEKAGLKDLAKRYDVKQKKAHSAMGDANTCKSVFFKMKDEIPTEDFEGLENVVGTSRQRKVEAVPEFTKEVRDY